MPQWESGGGCGDQEGRPPILWQGAASSCSLASGDQADNFTDAGARPEQSLSVEAPAANATFPPPFRSLNAVTAPYAARPTRSTGTKKTLRDREPAAGPAYGRGMPPRRRLGSVSCRPRAEIGRAYYKARRSLRFGETILVREMRLDAEGAWRKTRTKRCASASSELAPGSSQSPPTSAVASRGVSLRPLPRPMLLRPGGIPSGDG